jgi:predicted O-methyltransferase YrrM
LLARAKSIGPAYLVRRAKIKGQERWLAFPMKWLLQNFQARAMFALQNPGYTLKSLGRELAMSDERFLGKITGATATKIRGFLNEPVNTPEFASHLRKSEAIFRSHNMLSADLYAKKVLNQYAIVRALRPKCIIETGIASGVSSVYLLLAMRKNGQGQLHSIGLPDAAFLPVGKEMGWIVPEWLRGSWTVHEGDARELLPRLFNELGEVGVFIHDSLHTYDHMMWEFQIAYPHLPPLGVLISDDVLFNAAFEDFVAEAHVTEAQTLHGVGFLRKPVGLR